jgi:endonuclease YncB( thermonuclease family)
LIAGNPVTCITTGQMADRLPLARCRVNGKDVAALLVAGGFARDCPRQSRGNYAALERQAVVNVAGGFDLPPECVED